VFNRRIPPAKLEQEMNKLNHHLRQYRHNNSDGLICAYEGKGTEAFVSCLETEISELKNDTAHIISTGATLAKNLDGAAKEIADLNRQVERLTLANAGLNSRLSNSVDLHNEIVDENNELKAMVELFKDEFYFFISQYGCECAHPSCKKCEDTNDATKLLFKTPRQCLANVKADAVKEFVDSGVSPNSKAGCIGEFSMTTFQTCPECWQEQHDDCDLCNGETDENGRGDMKLDIPWTIQKDIFKAMLDFKHEYHANKLRES